MIDGKKFVLTGFMGVIDYELEDYIYDHGGDFVSTVTSDVEAVITGNVMEVSKKMVAASELGIYVLTIQEFSERYNIPLKRFEENTKGDKGNDGDDEKSDD
jgi:NAD-dependent DNA ligase